ncbi:50S ribosomal protein L24 [Candidatus Uhrbacteria bacterium]|nr:50S ribosomal protein L24 [Candidatus Uhrbacteria bacterium]
MTKLRIKKGDTVVVIAGKDKGKTGKVMQAFPAMGRVVVDGVNKCKRHLRPQRRGEKGQVVEFFMPINASNVMLQDASGKRVRHDKRAKE